jgi:hypothetical protein
MTAPPDPTHSIIHYGLQIAITEPEKLALQGLTHGYVYRCVARIAKANQRLVYDLAVALYLLGLRVDVVPLYSHRGRDVATYTLAGVVLKG